MNTRGWCLASGVFLLFLIAMSVVQSHICSGLEDRVDARLREFEAKDVIVRIQETGEIVGKRGDNNYHKAPKLAEEASGKGDAGLARIYLLNAAMHCDGDDVECYRKYVDLVMTDNKKDDEWRINELVRVEDLLGGALGTADANAVAPLIALLRDVEAKRERFALNAPPAEESDLDEPKPEDVAFLEA